MYADLQWSFHKLKMKRKHQKDFCQKLDGKKATLPTEKHHSPSPYHPMLGVIVMHKINFYAHTNIQWPDNVDSNLCFSKGLNKCVPVNRMGRAELTQLNQYLVSAD